MIISKLLYYSNVWANTSTCNINKLQTVQNFACRLVSCARLHPFVKSSIGFLWQTSFITVAQQWPLNVRRATSSKFLKRAEVSGRSTRNSQLLNIPLFKTASGQRTFYYRIVNLCNSLDYSLKLCNSVSVFKNRLRTKLLKVAEQSFRPRSS